MSTISSNSEVVNGYKFATNDDLSNEGFPDKHVASFLKVANELSCVILTRTPGKICRGLLEEGYDAKCFHIKAKTCNFGPGAGFVCFDPLLNKNGAQQALENLIQNHLSLRKNAAYPSAGTMQLRISDNRISELEALKIIKIDNSVLGNKNQKKYFFNFGSKEIAGVFVRDPATKTNAVFYDLESLYLGAPATDADRIGNRINDVIFEKLKLYMGSDIDNKLLLIQKKYEMKETLKEIFVDGIMSKSTIRVDNSRQFFYPLMVMINPFPSYRDANLLHLNAVTGDYDLFSVWPLKPSPSASGEKVISVLDSRVAGMHINMTDQQIVEAEKISPIGSTVGNISERIYFVAQKINSEIMYSYAIKAMVEQTDKVTGEKKSVEISTAVPNQRANRVYHSDEAGRPCVDSVDACAAFMPENPKFPAGKQFILNSPDSLKKFMEDCNENGYSVFINKGWVTPLGLIGNEPWICWSSSIAS